MRVEGERRVRALVQRVSRGVVHVDGEMVGVIGKGLVVFAGVTQSDDERDVEFLVNKIANLRIFQDAGGKFNNSALDVRAEILVVSQFTLYANTRRGRRPDLTDAARPEQAEPLVTALVKGLEAAGLRVATGRFQARMMVEVYNDGPVSIWLDSKER